MNANLALCPITLPLAPVETPTFSQKSHSNNAQPLRRSIRKHRGLRPALLTAFLQTRGWSRDCGGKPNEFDGCVCIQSVACPDSGMSLSRKKSLACSRKLGCHCGRGRGCEVGSPLTAFLATAPARRTPSHQEKQRADISQALNSEEARWGRKAGRTQQLKCANFQRQIRDAIEIPFRPSIVSSYIEMGQVVG